MKPTFTFLLSLTILLTACKKDIPFKNDYNDSFRTWQSTKKSWNNSYVYVVANGSWTGFGSETTITVINGVISSRAYKSSQYDPGTRLITPLSSWTEDKNSLGTHTEGAGLLTLDQVYTKAKDVWLKADKTENDIYFEAKNGGIISSCGFVPKNCADDCFNGITITSVKNIIIN